MLLRRSKNNKMTLDSRGFTLAEVMIALGIFSIGLLGVSALRMTIIKSNALASRHTDATIIASGRVERLMSAQYTDPDLIAGAIGIPVVYPTVALQPPYSLTWTVTALDLDGDTDEDMKSINVDVSWSLATEGKTRNTSFNFRKAMP